MNVLFIARDRIVVKIARLCREHPLPQDARFTGAGEYSTAKVLPSLQARELLVRVTPDATAATLTGVLAPFGGLATLSVDPAPVSALPAIVDDRCAFAE